MVRYWKMSWKWEQNAGEKHQIKALLTQQIYNAFFICNFLQPNKGAQIVGNADQYLDISVKL